jgi:hypothetical protein
MRQGQPLSRTMAAAGPAVALAVAVPAVVALLALDSAGEAREAEARAAQVTAGAGAAQRLADLETGARAHVDSATAVTADAQRSELHARAGARMPGAARGAPRPASAGVAACAGRHGALVF